MATFLHGKNTRVLFSNPAVNLGYDLSQYFNDAAVSRSLEASEVTTFQTSGVKSFVTGLGTGTIALSGFYDGTSSGIDSIISTAISNTANEAILVFPAGGTAQNDRCYMAQGIETKYDLKSPVSGVVSIDAEVQADGGVWNGFGQFFTTTTSGSTTVLDGKSPSTRGGLFVIGVLSLTGTLSVTLQHSADNSTWVNATSAVTGVGTSVVSTASLPSTIYRYTRLNWTLTGTNATSNIYFGFARY